VSDHRSVIIWFAANDASDASQQVDHGDRSIVTLGTTTEAPEVARPLVVLPLVGLPHHAAALTYGAIVLTAWGKAPYVWERSSADPGDPSRCNLGLIRLAEDD
jgi:hypothetical protein